MAAMRLPVGRTGQALAVGVALLLLLLVWLAAVSPLLDWYADRAQAAVRARAIEARMAGLVEALPLLRREAARAAERGPPQASLLSGSSDAVAAATLQGRIQDMATSAGTALSSTEALPARQQGAYRRIGLRVSFSADLSVFTHLLQTIDESAPRMLVDDIQLHTSPIVVMQQKGGSAPPLDVSMTVIGFRAGSAVDNDAAAAPAPSDTSTDGQP